MIGGLTALFIITVVGLALIFTGNSQEDEDGEA